MALPIVLVDVALWPSCHYSVSWACITCNLCSPTERRSLLFTLTEIWLGTWLPLLISWEMLTQSRCPSTTGQGRGWSASFHLPPLLLDLHSVLSLPSLATPSSCLPAFTGKYYHHHKYLSISVDNTFSILILKSLTPLSPLTFVLPTAWATDPLGHTLSLVVT